MDHPSESEIARGLRAGESSAWSALYEAYFERVWAAAAQVAGGGSRAERAEVADIVQETFLAAARGARQFDPNRGCLWQWLSGIVRKQALLSFRQRKRDSRIAPGGDLLDAVLVRVHAWLEHRQPSPEAALQSAEVAEAVRLTLADLPEDYADLLMERYLDEISGDAMAAARGCSVEALRSKLARARKAFRKSFGKLSVAASDWKETKPSAYPSSARDAETPK